MEKEFVEKFIQVNKKTWPLKFLDIDGTKLAYLEEGKLDKEVIILLHGYMGSHLTWRHLIEPLSKKYRVFAFDWFGWGASDRSLMLKYDFNTEVDRLRRIIEQLNLSKVNLFGHDYGGLLSLGLCQHFPHLVRRLSLLNTKAHKSFKPMWFLIFEIMSRSGKLAIGKYLGSKLPLVSMHKFFVKRELEQKIIDEQALQSYIYWMKDDLTGGKFLMHFFSDYTVAANKSILPKLKTIICPTAIIWGEDDMFLSSEIAKELASYIPNASLTLIKAGHFVTEEQPERVLQAFNELLCK